MTAILDAAAAQRPARIGCPLCGELYDPDEHAACQGCPLNAGCALSCCPRCGFSTADPGRSWLLRNLGKLSRR